MAVAAIATLCLSAGPAWAQRGGQHGGNSGGARPAAQAAPRSAPMAQTAPRPMGSSAPMQRFVAPPSRMSQGVAVPRVGPQTVAPQRFATTGNWSRVAPVAVGGTAVVGHAVARPIPNHAVVVGGGGVVVGRPVVVAPFYSVPYYHFHPHFFFSFGLSVGYPVAFPYGAYYAPYAYPYPYPVYGYPSYGMSTGYPDGAYFDSNGSYNGSSAGYPTSGNPTSTDPDASQYGGLSFDITPNDAAVFVDGKYVGTVSDFSAQQPPLALKIGKHHVDIRAQGYETMSFDTDVTAAQVTPFQGQMKIK